MLSQTVTLLPVRTDPICSEFVGADLAQTMTTTTIFRDQMMSRDVQLVKKVYNNRNFNSVSSPMVYSMY